MPFDRRTMLAALAAAVTPGAARAVTAPAPTRATTETVPLWPGQAPGSPPALPTPKLRREGPAGRKEFHLRGVAAPAMFVYRPAKPNGVGLIVMPGGGYSLLSVENEGTDVARYYTALGITVFVLSYRLPGEGWTNRADAPLQDAIRAIRLVRARAAGFKVDPDRIGILGFSAGGHVAASLATDHAIPLYDPIDAADRLSAKPTFTGLLYAVTTMKQFETHSGSRANLLGPSPSLELVARRSPLLHVGKDTPPCFVAHALDDDIVPPACSIDWMAACRTAQVPVEAHLIERGGHGFGLRLPPDNPGSRWPELFHLWARHHGG